MIIKLHPPVFSTFARQTENRVAKVPTFKEKVNFDRIVMAVFYLSGIVATILFS